MCQKGNHVPSMAFLCPQESFQVPQSPPNMHGLDPAHCISCLSTSVTTMSPHRPSGPASEPLHRHSTLRGQSSTYRHTGLLHHSTYLFLRSQFKWSSLKNHPALFISSWHSTPLAIMYVFSCLSFLCLLESKFSKDPDLSSLPVRPPPPNYFFSAIDSAWSLIIKTNINNKVRVSDIFWECAHFWHTVQRHFTYVLTQLILRSILWGRYDYYPHFAGKETEWSSHSPMLI